MKNQQKRPDSIACTIDGGPGILLLEALTTSRLLETAIAVIAASIPAKINSTQFLFCITCFLFKD